MRLSRFTAVLFAAPAVLLFVLFVAYPAADGIRLSFTNSRGLLNGSLVGFANYVAAFHDPAVRAALWNTLIYTVVTVVVQNVLSLGLAHWMFTQPRLRGLVRVGTLAPAMMALVAVGYVWSFIYSPISGPLNAMLGAFGLGSLEQSWLGDPSTALLAVAATNVWMYIGYSATIYLSGYMTIPPSIFEAAAMDGARGWGLFRSVEWPLLAPALTVNLVLSTIGSLRVFELVLIMTNGGPGNSTQSLSYIIFNESFGDLQFGYGSAIAVLLLVLTVVVAFLLTTFLRRREVAW